MKKLWPLLLLTGCLQQGLVATQNTEALSSSSSSLGPEVARIKMERRNSQFLNTKFSDIAYSSTKPIRGYGDITAQGETFCISNENEANGATFDSQVNCRRPLNSVEMPAAEQTLADDFTEHTGRTSTSGLPLIFHGIQFYFSNSATNLSTNIFSQIDPGLKITVKTAPIVFSSTTGIFTWDTTQESSNNYTGNGTCSLASTGAVGFNLSDGSIPSSEKKNYFLTGLWIFERSVTKPYDSGTAVQPIGSYSGSTDGPSRLFATRTNVFASLLLPSEDSVDEDYAFQFFPGAGNLPSDTAQPFKYTFGLYRQDDAIQSTNDATSGEESRSAAQNLTGAYVTPVMGKYNSAGALVTGWQNRVITGLCVQGTRRTYNGLVSGVLTPIYESPVIHAVKYELRKLRVVVE